MDPVGKLISITNRYVPELGARLAWQRDRGSDAALRLVDGLVRRGDRVIDIGANWGLFAHRLSQLVGPDGHVDAFEPDPLTAARLIRLLGRRPNVTIHRVALSDHAGSADLHIPVVEGRRLSALASLGPPAQRSALRYEVASIRVERLDALISEDRPVTFIKCDVEGHELEVLHGAVALLRRWQPSLLVEIEQRHQQGDIRATFDYLTGLGYRGYPVYQGGLRPLAEFDVARDQAAFVGAEFIAHAMPPGYVSDFLWVGPRVDVVRWLEHDGAGRAARAVTA